jgi:DUF1365 family protein
VSTQSCIYEGHVRHHRFQPVVNQFRYRVFLMYLDLGEVPTLFQGRRFWSSDRVNLAYFRRRDHLGDPRVPLDRAVRDLVEEKTGKRPQGAIRLLTHLRYFGYCFNPASFYYCYDPSGGRVETIVVQIHNTPWGEEYCYVLDEAKNEHSSPIFKRFQFPKAFHVSPFMPMDIWYDWRLKEPGKTLSAHFTSFYEGKRIFDATLTLSRREITPHNLTRVLLAYPPMTLKVITMIHWQALRLWLKGARFYVHPKELKDRGAGKS